MLEQLAKHYEQNLRKFDPTNPMDLTAYYSLRYKGKQLGNRRYILEQPFPDVVSMMHHKIAEQVLREKFPEELAEADLNYG